jgi:hypothetical protein
MLNFWRNFGADAQSSRRNNEEKDEGLNGKIECAAVLERTAACLHISFSASSRPALRQVAANHRPSRPALK